MPDAAVAGKLKLAIDVKRADGTLEHHEAAPAGLQIAPEAAAVFSQITSDPNAQLALAIACATDPGVLVALRRSVGG